MGKLDPPSDDALALLHYLQDLCNYGHTYPSTRSDTSKLIWFFIKRLRHDPWEWPVALIEGNAGGIVGMEDVAGVTSIRADANPLLTGAVVLASGAGITLTEVGQTITFAASAQKPVAGFDYPPRLPDSRNLEVRDAQGGVLPSGWTVVGNSGGAAPSYQAVAGVFDNFAPNTNAYNVNDDCLGKFVMVPAGAKVIAAYRSFASAAGAKFAVVAKVSMAFFGTPTVDDRLTLCVHKTAPVSTDNDYGSDSLALEWRPFAATPDFRSFVVNAGVAGALTSLTGNPSFPAMHSQAVYLAITCETSDALSTWVSRDGFTWIRVQRYTAGNVIANVNFAGFAVRDDAGGAETMGAVEFVRFAAGQNNVWHLGFGGQ